MIIVGDCCTTKRDPRFMEPGEKWSRSPMAPELRLDPEKLVVLRAIGQGRVYRRPSKAHVMPAAGDTPRSVDPQVTAAMEELAALGLVHWGPTLMATRTLVLSNGQPAVQPTAWAQINEAGTAYLRRFDEQLAKGTRR